MPNNLENANPRNTPPFRADHVGSFLRPATLKQGRSDYAAGRISRADLKLIEDKEIIKLVEKQKENGLRAVTDGEFRRRWWHLDFIEQLNGITKYSLGNIKTFQNVSMENAEAYFLSGTLSFNPSHSFLDDFKFLKAQAGQHVAKQTIPGPNMIYLGGAILNAKYQESPAYNSDAALQEAIVNTYQQAIQAFYDAGCRYLQLDDTAWGRLLDVAPDEKVTGTSLTGAELTEKCAELTKRALAKKPSDMAVTFHFCRGNFKSSWLYEGSYDAIAKSLFSIENLDGFFLEYDDERSGDFTPLKNLKGQQLVLGLVSSKSGKLEDKEYLKKRIAEAAKFAPLNQLCISPQCGFSSTEEGNALSEDDQWRKIRLVAEVAKEVWK